MPTVEGNETIEGRSPGQASPFQEQLKSRRLDVKSGQSHKLLRPNVWVLETPNVDCSDSPDTSEPQDVHLDMDNNSLSGKGSGLNNRCCVENEHRDHETRGSKDLIRLDIPRKSKANSESGPNQRAETRLDSDERRLMRFDSLSDTNCSEFGKELKKLASSRSPVKTNEHQNIVVSQQARVAYLSRSKERSQTGLPRSEYDNCPLSATSNPLHIYILKDKEDSKTSASMPPIVPPEDVLNNVVHKRGMPTMSEKMMHSQIPRLSNEYNVRFPASMNYCKHLQTPLLEGSMESSTSNVVSQTDDTGWMIQEITEKQRCSRHWICCC